MSFPPTCIIIIQKKKENFVLVFNLFLIAFKSFALTGFENMIGKEDIGRNIVNSSKLTTLFYFLTIFYVNVIVGLD